MKSMGNAEFHVQEVGSWYSGRLKKILFRICLKISLHSNVETWIGEQYTRVYESALSLRGNHAFLIRPQALDTF